MKTRKGENKKRLSVSESPDFHPALQKVFYCKKNGAGDGNRTHNISLEGWSFTTKLHPLENFG